MSVAFVPLLPWPLLAALAAAAAVGVALALAGRLRGWSWRGLTLAAALAALAGPAWRSAERRALDDVVILLDDRSASATLPGRAAQTDAAVAALEAAVAARPGTQLRRVTVGDHPDGTRLGAALARALAAEPPERVAGVLAITDGQVHDAPALPAAPGAPVHVLLTGQGDDWDRRLVIEEAPSFGLIGEPVSLRLRIEDTGAVPPAMAGRAARLTVALDGEAPQTVAVPPGLPLELPVVPRHAGANVVSLEIDAAEGQLTPDNDRAAVTLTGVRDRLRVLLVSGEPHAGERTWRNLLRSDAAVDLIHFTILRPPDKADGVPVDEMALIAFPTRELFLERIDDFDLIIFDRYRERGILPPEYFDAIRGYVLRGGAILVAGGPETAGIEGLSRTVLGEVLPARPTGRVIEQPLRPVRTEAGRRHPVTATLPGAEGPDGPTWGRWLRMIEVVPASDAVSVLEAEGRPLLVLGRAGEGRAALLASDHAWLWARGFEGGGPQLELLRRIAHWSMGEPELEEEALEVAVEDGARLRVTRRTLRDDLPEVAITGPDGARATLSLAPDAAAPGRATGVWTAPGPGLYRLAQGDLTRVVAVGPAAPRELAEPVASADALAPLVDASGGTVTRLEEGVPGLRWVRAGRPTSGQGAGGPWIALTPRGAETVTGQRQVPLLPGWAWLVLVAGLSLMAWLREGRRG